MSGEDCIFCKIIGGEIPSFKVMENESCVAFLDVFPASVGHCLVVPKHHCKLLSELPEEYAFASMKMVQKISAAVGKMENVTGCNVLQNNGRSAGQLINHVHFHIIPRKDGDGVMHCPSSGGQLDKDMGNGIKDTVISLLE